MSSHVCFAGLSIRDRLPIIDVLSDCERQSIYVALAVHVLKWRISAEDRMVPWFMIIRPAPIMPA